MKHENISIKWRIFVYLLGFTVLLLILLWFFQTVYLEVFYKAIKTNDLNQAMSDVVSAINDEDINDEIESISKKYDISILVTDNTGKEIASSFRNFDNIIHKLSEIQIREFYWQAHENNGSLKINLNDKENRISDFAGSRFEFVPNLRKESKINSVVYLKIITTENGNEKIILLNSLITPVDATVHTLRIQLLYISVILILLSLIIALLISRRVSKSIIQVNQSAKELAKGNFQVKFNGIDYKEIAELSDTLNKTAQELAKAENLQKELIANVSHDLRTPLTMITAYAEVMRDLPGENNPENVQVVIDEAKRLTDLVNDLLDISKIQAGVTSIMPKKYDLTESIKSIIGRYAKLIEQDGYKIEFDYSGNISVEADEHKIYQVIYNLINNAINYTGRDKLVQVKQIVYGEIVRIEVKDTGNGIAKKELENVWERYYKIDKEHKQAIMGTGLGLSIVKNILKLHNANYGVDSIEGEGCTFWFELKITFPKLY